MLDFQYFTWDKKCCCCFFSPTLASVHELAIEWHSSYVFFFFNYFERFEKGASVFYFCFHASSYLESLDISRDVHPPGDTPNGFISLDVWAFVTISDGGQSRIHGIISWGALNQAKSIILSFIRFYVVLVFCFFSFCFFFFLIIITINNQQSIFKACVSNVVCAFLCY